MTTKCGEPNSDDPRIVESKSPSPVALLSTIFLLVVEMRRNPNIDLANLGMTVSHNGPHNISRPVNPDKNAIAYRNANWRRAHADISAEGPYSNVNVSTTAPSYPTYLFPNPDTGVAAAKGIGSRDNLSKSHKPCRLVAVTKAQDNGTA